MNKYLCIYEYYETTEVGIIFAETTEKAQVIFAIAKCQELNGEGGLWLSDTYKDVDDVKKFCQKLKDKLLLGNYIKVYNIDEVTENSTAERIFHSKQPTEYKFTPLGSTDDYNDCNILKNKLNTKRR